MAQFTNPNPNTLEFRSSIKSDVLTDYKYLIPIRDADFINSICSETKHASLIHKNIGKLFYNKNYTFKRTVLDWLSFFKNTTFPHNPSLYGLIVGFLDYLHRFEDFKTLTSEQVSYCKQNFITALESQKDFIDEKIETDLVVNCVLLAKYPQLQQRSLQETLQYYDKDYDDQTLFSHLFCKRDELYFLSFHFNYCKAYEVDLSIQLVQGKSLRKLLKNDLNLSKTETALFHTHPYYLWEQPEQPIKHYYCEYKLLKYAPSHSEYIGVLFKSCRIYETDFPLFYKDIDFWKEVFLFLIKYQLKDRYEAIEILDYFMDQRYENGEPYVYNIKGRTLASVKKALHYWHNVELPRLILEEDMHWRAQEIEKNITSTWQGLSLKTWQKDNLVIDEITDDFRLGFEGSDLDHCVYSYLSDCELKHTHIFSYHRKEITGIYPILTIEVHNNRVKQVSGKGNRKPKKNELEHVLDWALNNGLILDKNLIVWG